MSCLHKECIFCKTVEKFLGLRGQVGLQELGIITGKQ